MPMRYDYERYGQHPEWEERRFGTDRFSFEEEPEHYVDDRFLRRSWSPIAWTAIGFGLGLVAYALLDSRRGAARRAMLVDKTKSFGRELIDRTERRAQDLKWRAQGSAHELKARMQEEDVPNHILEERVRAQLGRPVTHPRALDVRAEDGCITLSGPILAHEVDELLRRVGKVRGVREVRNQLEVHQTPENIPSLQGSGSRQSRG